MMAPNHHHFAINSLTMEPVSRTYQYRKIMKPMLERKRRARINKCLEELKDLMTGTLQADGENISKLEKADILELTVRHLHRLRESNTLFMRPDPVNVDKFWAGFHHCATEVTQFLTKYDRHITGDLLKHISTFMPNITAAIGASAAQYQRYPMPQANVLYPIQLPASAASTTAKTLRKPFPKEEILDCGGTDTDGGGDGIGGGGCEGGVWRPW
ncbi:enhancer of split mgamma protein-like [Eupeodes corollae]|uniref:enhancer of split mgamma protein-like n=1 Tax=Eupeodes corollae TaxID=290404 RepID=UPI0024911D0A|nr:enhancer of split mgamma protein-like [Eupeodes corollae]